MKLLTLCVTILLNILYTQLTAQDNSNNDLPLNKISYNEYSLSIPGDWWFSTQPNYGAIFFVYAPYKNNNITSNCNFLIQNQPEPVSAEEFLELSINEVNQYLKNPKIITQKITDGLNGKVLELEYTGLLDNQQMHWYQYAWSVGKSNYVLTFTSSSDDYPVLINYFKKIYESFVVNKNPK